MDVCGCSAGVVYNNYAYNDPMTATAAARPTATWPAFTTPHFQSVIDKVSSALLMVQLQAVGASAGTHTYIHTHTARVRTRTHMHRGCHHQACSQACICFPPLLEIVPPCPALSRRTFTASSTPTAQTWLAYKQQTILGTQGSATPCLLCLKVTLAECLCRPVTDRAVTGQAAATWAVRASWSQQCYSVPLLASCALS